MSRWSTSATSPRARCLTSSFVRRPARTDPRTARVATLWRSGPTGIRADAREPFERRASRAPGAGPALRTVCPLGRVAAIGPAKGNARARGAPIAGGRSGRAAQVARVAASDGVAGIGAEHAHQLRHDLWLTQLGHGRPRGARGGGLHAGAVAVPARRHLPQGGGGLALPGARQLPGEAP